MPVQSREDSSTEQVSEAIAQATQVAKLASEALQSATESVTPTALRLVEEGTENLGKFITPIAENPLVKYAAKVPGIKWFVAGLGQVDVDKAHNEVEKLRQEYPLETPEQLAHRIIVDTSLKAAGIGLLTNFVPPLALTLFAVDIAAISALQAEMIYRIAAVYGFSLKDPTRRGEVLAIFGLSVGGSGVLKVGFGLVELLPIIGAVVGASNDAALLYSLGFVACRFYELKINSIAPQTVSDVGNLTNRNIAT